MIWLTWRQSRTQLWVGLAAVAAAIILMAIDGHALAQAYAGSGLTTCHATGDCGSAKESFLNQVQGHAAEVVYNLGHALLYVLPPLLGIFWGAPLVAREFEAGTHRLAWNQSVTRTRWLAVKLAAIGTAAMAVAGLISLAVTWSAHRLDQVQDNRITPLHFGARGIVPIGYAAFAFALGVVAGMVIRRTVPAMATTLAIYIGAVVAMPLWVRAHLIPAKHGSVPLDMDKIRGFGTSAGGSRMEVLADVNKPGAWILGNTTTTSAGKPFVGPADQQYCGRDISPQTCLNWIADQHLRQSITYQPGSRFWALQWSETGIFLVLAALLVGVAFWWLRRRAN